MKGQQSDHSRYCVADEKFFVQQTIQIEDEIDDLEEELREKHIERLARNQCSAAKGVIYLDILNNIERISHL